MPEFGRTPTGSMTILTHKPREIEIVCEREEMMPGTVGGREREKEMDGDRWRERDGQRVREKRKGRKGKRRE